MCVRLQLDISHPAGSFVITDDGFFGVVEASFLEYGLIRFNETDEPRPMLWETVRGTHRFGPLRSI